MTYNKLVLISYACLGLLPIPAMAAEYHCTSFSDNLRDKPVTLLQLTNVALSCNPSTRLAWSQVKLSWANLGLTRSPYWPQLTGTYDYTDNSVRPVGETLVHQYSHGPSISLSYLLWDFGATAQKVKAADLQLQAARFNQNYAIQQIITQVEESYYQVVGQKALVISSKDSVKENKTNLEAARALHKQGLATIGDVYQAESALLQSELTLQQAEGAFEIFKGQLSSNVGIPVETPLALSDMPKEIKTKPLLDFTDKLIDFARKHRSDFIALKKQVYSSNSALRAAKRQFWPTLQFSTNTQRLYSTTPRSGSGDSLNGFSNSIKLSLNFPIFTGFSNTYAIKQAEAQKLQAEAQRDTLEQQVALQVWQSYFNLQTAAKSLNSGGALLKSTVQAAKQAYGQYRSGVGNILTVLSTQSAASSARSQLIQAKMNWYTALAQFSSALGNVTGHEQNTDN